MPAGMGLKQPKKDKFVAKTDIFVKEEKMFNSPLRRHRDYR